MTGAPTHTYPVVVPVTAEFLARNSDKERAYRERRKEWRAQFADAPTPVRTWLSARTSARATVHDPRQARLL
jgi:hypothetical protein